MTGVGLLGIHADARLRFCDAVPPHNPLHPQGRVRYDRHRDMAECIRPALKQQRRVHHDDVLAAGCNAPAHFFHDERMGDAVQFLRGNRIRKGAFGQKWTV